MVEIYELCSEFDKIWSNISKMMVLKLAVVQDVFKDAAAAVLQGGGLGDNAASATAPDVAATASWGNRTFMYNSSGGCPETS